MTKHNPWAGVGRPANDVGNRPLNARDQDTALLLTRALTKVLLAHRADHAVTFTSMTGFVAGYCMYVSNCVPGEPDCDAASFERARSATNLLCQNSLKIIESEEREERPQGGER